ncbi:MAG TPA: hypothetical protein VFY28_03555 [Candidatus Paceibacterota bacterium]|nr:hypothetical protein [Candidatus Paceibacterota bacterium]
MEDVVFDSERVEAPRRANRSSRLPRIVMPNAPKKDNKAEMALTCVLGVVLAGSVYVAMETRPKPIELATPETASVINRAIIKP